MKKLTMLIAMILCVTIGGVYATWYFTDITDVTDVSSPIAVNLELTGEAGPYGTYSISKSSTTTPIRIDQKETGNHTAVLKTDGTIIVTFTPNPNADLTVKNNAVDTYIYFSGNLADIKYTDTNSANIAVFKFTRAASFETKEKITLVKGADGKFTCDITELVAGKENSVVQLNSTFVLDSLTKYRAFEAAIANLAINVHITDGTLTPAS